MLAALVSEGQSLLSSHDPGQAGTGGRQAPTACGTCATAYTCAPLHVLLPGLPKGVLNIVHGTHDTVNRVLDHPDIASISFVGSGAGTETGVELFP